MNCYALLITYPHDTRPVLASSTKYNYVRADEDNRYLLMDLAAKLLDENIIVSAQIVKFDGPPMTADLLTK